MYQIVQHMGSGITELLEAPSPICNKNSLLIQTTCSLISAGTERMLVGFGKSNLLQKAQQQPEKVKMVVNKIQTDGLVTTIDAVRSKLAQPLPLGYCNVGVVAETGVDTQGFRVGDRVVSNGSHADIVRVPPNLACRIPDNVDDETASFTVVASIGLQGIRLAEPTLGEAFVVTGAGLIGLLTIQLLRAHGCRVLAIDIDDAKLSLAREFGAETCNPVAGEDAVSAGLAFSRGRGVDGVIITASTKSSDLVSQAALMSRKRGRIVLVGVTGLELNRADFYDKEITFQVSCSYGPGRYDNSYEEEGNDYPIGFVRWTEQRNFESVLDMLSDGRLNVQPLITHRVPFEEAPAAYELLTSNSDALGILLEYKPKKDHVFVSKISLEQKIVFKQNSPVIGLIGAGNYASRVLIPAFKSARAQLHTIVTSGGVNSVIHGRSSGFKDASTNVSDVFENSEINTVVVATRHDSHSDFVSKALEAGKHVFVEKPLAINIEGLDKIEHAYNKNVVRNNSLQLMVGFNRRFSPQIMKMYELLNTINEPKSFLMTINAGAIPSDHWTQIESIGGGRIIGEACHFIDLMRFLANSPITSVQAKRIEDINSRCITEDKASITLTFADGSFGTIMYLANGSPSFPKERIEIFSAGKVLQLDNFIKLKGFGWDKFKNMNLWKQDKGQNQCVASFIKSVESGIPAIPFEQIFEVARVTINVAQILRDQ
jgi:predicted dehydrogenase/threonine dehydrogenase-like Zn-dependent dehydrogenase